MPTCESYETIRCFSVTLKLFPPEENNTITTVIHHTTTKKRKKSSKLRNGKSDRKTDKDDDKKEGAIMKRTRTDSISSASSNSNNQTNTVDKTLFENYNNSLYFKLERVIEERNARLKSSLTSAEKQLKDSTQLTSANVHPLLLLFEKFYDQQQISSEQAIRIDKDLARYKKQVNEKDNKIQALSKDLDKQVGMLRVSKAKERTQQYRLIELDNEKLEFEGKLEEASVNNKVKTDEWLQEKLNFKQEIKSYQQSLKEIKDENNMLSAKVEAQEVHSKRINSLEKLLEDKKGEACTFDKDLKELTKRLNNTMNELQKTKKEKSKYYEKMLGLQTENENFKKENNKLTKQLQNAKNNLASNLDEASKVNLKKRDFDASPVLENHGPYDKKAPGTQVRRSPIGGSRMVNGNGNGSEIRKRYPSNNNTVSSNVRDSIGINGVISGSPSLKNLPNSSKSNTSFLTNNLNLVEGGHHTPPIVSDRNGRCSKPWGDQIGYNTTTKEDITGTAHWHVKTDQNLTAASDNKNRQENGILNSHDTKRLNGPYDHKTSKSAADNLFGDTSSFSDHPSVNNRLGQLDSVNSIFSNDEPSIPSRSLSSFNRGYGYSDYRDNRDSLIGGFSNNSRDRDHNNMRNNVGVANGTMNGEHINGLVNGNQTGNSSTKNPPTVRILQRNNSSGERGNVNNQQNNSSNNNERINGLPSVNGLNNGNPNLHNGNTINNERNLQNHRIGSVNGNLTSTINNSNINNNKNDRNAQINGNLSPNNVSPTNLSDERENTNPRANYFDNLFDNNTENTFMNNFQSSNFFSQVTLDSN